MLVKAATGIHGLSLFGVLWMISIAFYDTDNFYSIWKKGYCKLMYIESKKTWLLWNTKIMSTHLTSAVIQTASVILVRKHRFIFVFSFISYEWESDDKNHNYIKWWDVLTHVCPNFYGSLAKLAKLLLILLEYKDVCDIKQNKREK